MKKVESDQMRQEYDFSSGIRGKYLPRLAKGANVVVLDRDMAKVFPSSKAVNDALRVLAEPEGDTVRRKAARAAFEQFHVIKAPTRALHRWQNQQGAYSFASTMLVMRFSLSG